MTVRLLVAAFAALVAGAAACSQNAPAAVRSSPTRASTAGPVVAARSSSPTAATPPASPSPTTAATPAPTATSHAASATTDLTFSGPLAGRAQSTTSPGPCGRAPVGYGAVVNVSVSGQPSVLSIAILDYGGPGGYEIPPERVSVRAGQGTSAQFMPAIRGTVTVDAGEKSGQIDAVVGDGSEHVSGTWACS